MTMQFLQPAVSSSAFLKTGVLGFQGGGKTLTSALVLIGLYKYMEERGLNDGTKPIAMFDTEKGSDWLIPIFEKAKVPFVVAKRQAFGDLLAVMDEAEKSAFGLLIDSVTHPWRELVEAYLRKKQRSYLAMDDWGYLKGEHGWKQFTDRFVNSKLHIVMAGRAGYEYENYVEDGRKKMEKVGTKMKTEGETGYEPDLLILMEQVEDLRSGKVVHRATVQKDRSTLIDGQTFDLASYDDEGRSLPVNAMVSQTFNAFLPHIRCLALGSPHVGVNTTGDSQHLLKLEKRDWQPVQRKIVLGELQDILVQHAGGQTIADKQKRIALLKTHFNGCGYVEIEETMPLIDLRAGYDSLHRELEKKPSRYASAMEKDATSADIDDALPDWDPLAKPTAVVVSTMVPAVTETVTDDLAIPAALCRVPVPAAAETVTDDLAIPAALCRVPAVEKSDEPEFDDAAWLAELTKAFKYCIDFASFGETQQTLMAPNKTKVSPASWKKAVKLASSCMTELMESGGAMAVAAE